MGTNDGEAPTTHLHFGLPYPLGEEACSILLKMTCGMLPGLLYTRFSVGGEILGHPELHGYHLPSRDPWQGEQEVVGDYRATGLSWREGGEG